jgi:hypothetical protein
VGWELGGLPVGSSRILGPCPELREFPVVARRCWLRGMCGDRLEARVRVDTALTDDIDSWAVWKPLSIGCVCVGGGG